MYLTSMLAIPAYVCLLLFAFSGAAESRLRQKRATFSRGSSVSLSGSGTSIICGDVDCQVCDSSGKCTRIKNGAQGMSIVQKNGCDLAICHESCEGFVLQEENGNRCPTCKCAGFGTKEPCEQNGDCKSGKCRMDLGLCEYPQPVGPIATQCAFHSDCEETQLCQEGFCENPETPLQKKHIKGIHCVFQHACPTGYTCKKEEMTCWEGADFEHIQGKSCIFASNCPAGYHCDQAMMTCIKGNSPGGNGGGFGGGNGGGFGGGNSGNSGNSGNGGNNGGGGGSTGLGSNGKFCVFTSQCPSKYRCDPGSSSCVSGGPEHNAQFCVLEGSCETGYKCDLTQSVCVKE